MLFPMFDSLDTIDRTKFQPVLTTMKTSKSKSLRRHSVWNRMYEMVTNYTRYLVMLRLASCPLYAFHYEVLPVMPVVLRGYSYLFV